MQALNVRDGLFMDGDGNVYPVTNWFDADGDECEREDAVTAVAGEGGCWFSITLSEFLSSEPH